MRFSTTKALSLLLSVVGLVAGSRPATAAIHGLLEAPVGYASQVSNVQGWAYTDTPDAELIQPFDVFLDGVKIQQIPCCSDRGDVQDENPGAPLQTGFSGVVNWAREALDGDTALLTVEIRDTAGGELILSEQIDLYAMTTGFPFSRSVAFASALDPLALLPLGMPAAAPLEDQIVSRCSLSNVSGDNGHSVAELACTNLTATKGDGSESEICDGEVRFTWDKASQGFQQSSHCEPQPHWVDNGDGTATDNTTGLMWELKTGDPEEERVECENVGSAATCFDPHHVGNMYSWSTGIPYVPSGSAFVLFLAQLNGAYSENGTTSTGCFAGYCDWRMPTVEELRTLLKGPCLVIGRCPEIPGPSGDFFHWSQSQGPQGKHAWDVDPLTGFSEELFKTEFDLVRAVRGPSLKVPEAEPEVLF